jgi:hypothetical protein
MLQAVGTGAAAVAVPGTRSGAAGPPPGPTAATPYYEFCFYKINRTTGANPLAGWLERHLVPALDRHGCGPTGVFTVSVGDHTPMMVRLNGFASLADRDARWAAVRADREFAESLNALERGPELPYEGAEVRLVRATDYAPPLSAAAGTTGHRVYEFRIYHSPTTWQLADLHTRFGQSELPIFHRLGIHPILYGSTEVGPDMPNLVYLIPFADYAAPEKAWDAFRADPEWQRVAAASKGQSGEIVTRIVKQYWNPTPYSQIG